jgi:hypothetical protein
VIADLVAAARAWAQAERMRALVERDIERLHGEIDRAWAQCAGADKLKLLGSDIRSLLADSFRAECAEQEALSALLEIARTV